MEKFEMITEEENLIEFRLLIDIHLDLEVIFYITISENYYSWSYLAGIEKWNNFSLQEKGFTMQESIYHETLSEEVKQKINNGFYELLRQLKNDHSYRLRVMNMLDDEIREIWEMI